MDELKKEDDEVTQDNLESKIDNNQEEKTSLYITKELSNTEDFEDDFESGGLLTDAQYDVPEDADKFVDVKDGQVIDKDKLTPFQIIKSVAEQNGNKIKDPYKGCKHCYGRGFEGKDLKTQMPIPCRCLFRGRTEEEKSKDDFYGSQIGYKLNRTQRRKISKNIFKNFKLQRKLLKNKIFDEDGINEKEIEEILEPEKKKDNELIDKVLKCYIKNKSIKKTAVDLSMTQTKIHNIIKENKELIEKMSKKE